MNAPPMVQERKHIICGMWGTTNLILSLVCVETGEIVATRRGRGVSKLSRKGIPNELFGHIADWIDCTNAKQVFLGGMVGSTLGWWVVPYMECPAPLVDIAAKAQSRALNGVEVYITPGLRAQNFLGEADVIRGEEIELLAWLHNRPAGSACRSLVCIPGTHTKWVEIADDVVTRFQTSVVGELFDLITHNGVLAQRGQDDAPHCEAAFLGGVEDAAKEPGNLLHLLMSVRTRSLVLNQTAAEASDRLSGLLIGADISTALRLADFEPEQGVLPIIGAPNLTDRYARAMRVFGLTPLAQNALNIGVTGFLQIAKTVEHSR